MKSKDRTLGNGKDVALRKSQGVFVIITVAENTRGYVRGLWFFAVKVYEVICSE